MNRTHTAMQQQNGVPSPREDLSRRYSLKFAETPQELESALRLRYSVFVEEMGEGCIDPNKPGLDTDSFDSTFHHLLIIDKHADKTVIFCFVTHFSISLSSKLFLLE